MVIWQQQREGRTKIKKIKHFFHGMWLRAYEAWGSGLIKGLGFDTDRKREGVDWNGVCLADGSSEGQSPCEATATRAIIPPRCIWISAMERSICLARGDTPPAADCRGCRQRRREAQSKSETGIETVLTEWGNMNTILISFLSRNVLHEYA